MRVTLTRSPAMIAIIVVLVPATTSAQEVRGTYRGSTRAVRFDISPPLRDMPSAAYRTAGGLMVDPDGEGESLPGPQDVDPLVQSSLGPESIPPPIVSFDGPPNSFEVSPPDPVGDVGPNHYVAMSNLSFAVYDKDGNVLYGPVANNTLWSGFGGACESSNSGDPIVLYDQLADRWMLTQFTASSSPYYNCVALSTGPDPTGTYYRWAFTTGSNFPDYPKYGVWPDAYYISTREFSAGFTYLGVGAYAANRAEMLAGNPSPQMISFFADRNPQYNVGDGLLPADLDGFTLPPDGSPHYWAGTMDDDRAYGAPQDAITLWEFVADFDTPANSSFTLTHTIPTAPFDSDFPCSPSSRNCIPQPGTSQKIDILSYRQRPLHRLAYRNLGSHESLVTNQSVEATSNLAGVRWYELRDPGGAPTIHQQGTYAPGATDGIHRWMGSIAMDEAGNIALGYSASSSSTFPSVWYTGRLATDPPGTMAQGEGSIIDGTGSQTDSGRWGDYTSLNVDPVDDCTFWYVNEYLPVTSPVGWKLRVGAFKFDECGTPDFTIAAAPSALDICAGSDAQVDVNIGSVASFANPVTLSASGEPAGTTVGFSENPVTPPGESMLTIGNTVVATAGDYAVTIAGAAASSPGHEVVVDLGVFDMTPEAPTLVEPADGAMNQPQTPTFVWAAGAQSATFTIDIATDEAFTDIVESATLEGTSHTISDPLASNTLYYWRVAATNPCGAGGSSLVFSFTTLPLPGDCPTGWVARRLYSYGFEDGPGGWTSGGTGDTWGQSIARVHSGAHSWLGVGSGSVSDQQLVSPAVTLPTGEGPLVLRFWNHQTLEDRAGGCYDGGILEISTDGGGAWTQLADAVLRTDPYDGPISSSSGNPLGGLDAWCGDPQDWLESVVDIDAYAGETVQLRFRLGTDSSVSREGWYLDDVLVQSCIVPVPPMFEDGFESGDTSVWGRRVP